MNEIAPGFSFSYLSILFFSFFFFFFFFSLLFFSFLFSPFFVHFFIFYFQICSTEMKGSTLLVKKLSERAKEFEREQYSLLGLFFSFFLNFFLFFFYFFYFKKKIHQNH